MTTANKNYPGLAFDPPPQEMVDATMLTVPGVSGQVPDTASDNIINAGFNAIVVERLISSTKPAGTVAYTVPKALTTAPKGTVVKLYISKGGLTKVPDVRGLTPNDAKKKLNDAGFPTVSVPQPSQVQFFVHDATVPSGNVVGTLPAAGKSVASSSAILLILSTGP